MPRGKSQPRKKINLALQGGGAYGATLRALTSESNGRLFHLVEQSSLAFEAGDRSLLDAESARSYCEGVGARLVLTGPDLRIAARS